ncbi:MAG: AsmA family protein [Geminicoccaceae bacterium]
MRFWIAAAVLLGLAALGLATVPHVIDWSAYRQDIETAAARLSGHDVTIGGPIEMTLLPRPVLIARDISVTGRTAEAIRFELSANQAEAALEIGPLLAGRPVVQNLELKRPILTVGGNDSQQLRFWPPRWQDWAAPFLQLNLKGIGIADGKIVLAGNQAHQPFSLSDISLQLLKDGPDGPLEAAGLFKTTHHSFIVTAAFGRPDGQGVSASKLTVQAKNGAEETTTLRFNGKMIPFGEDQGLRGRLTLNGPDLQHGLTAISTATGYPSTFLSIAPSQPFSVEGRINADRTGIQTEDLRLKLSEKLGKGRIDLQLHPQRQLDLSAELPALRLAGDADITDFLPLDLLSKLQMPPGLIDVRLREIIYRGESARQASVRLKTEQSGVTTIEQAKTRLPGLIDLGFEGKIYPGDVGPRLGGHLVAVGDDLKSSLSWLDLIESDDQDSDRRDGGWRSFSLESDVDVTSVEIALSAVDMRLDSSRIKGKASLRFSEQRRLSLDVDVERLNLDLYWPEWDAHSAAAGLTERISGLDAAIDARLRRLIWQGVHVEEGSISASAEEGRVTLSTLTAKTVGDTTLALKGTIDLERRAADLSAELSSQHPARALHHLKLDLPLSSTRLRPIALTGKVSGTPERLALGIEADYDQGDAAIEGQAGWMEDRPWYDLMINAHHPDHLALASQFGLAPLVPARDAEGPLELAGRLRHEMTTPWIASGNAKLGPTTFTGSLAYQSGALTGPFEAKLSIGTPQKDSLAPFLILSGLRLAGDWSPRRWLGRLPSTGLRTAWLEKVEGSLSLASKGGLVGDGLTLNARLNDGLLYIDKLKASPWQGRLEAEFSLERRRDQPFVAIAIDLDQVEAADIADWLGVKSGIEGPLDLRIEASSAGRTPYEMMAALAGEMEIGAGPGLIEGLGIPALRRTVDANRGDGAPADRSLSMPFSTIDAKAALSRGILSFEDARLVFDPASDTKTELGIDGTADLLLWIVDLTLTAIAKDAGPVIVPEVARVYRVVGPPDRPTGFAPTGN